MRRPSLRTGRADLPHPALRLEFLPQEDWSKAQWASARLKSPSAREDNIDTSILLKKPFDYVPEDGARFIVNFIKARVNTRDLPLIQDTRFHLQEDESGELVWTWGLLNNERKQKPSVCCLRE